MGVTFERNEAGGRRRLTASLAAAGVMAAIAVTAIAVAAPPVGTPVVAPVVCSRGPGGKHFSVSVALPRTVAQSSTYDVRLDGIPTGKISGFGLNYTHDIAGSTTCSLRARCTSKARPTSFRERGLRT